MTDLATVNYFKDPAVVVDPWPYYDFLLADRPVWTEPNFGCVLVAGWEEAVEVLRDHETYSSANIVCGPVPPFSESPLERGDDITDWVEQHRDELPQSDQLVTFDPPKHSNHRSLINGLITPKRLKENEDFMWRLAERKVGELVPRRRVEFINEFAQPYTLLVIADLLGVPEVDHPRLLKSVGIGALPGEEGFEKNAHHSLAPLYDYFMAAIDARRTNPQQDVLTGMAQADFPDGTTPELVDVARIASNMFAAGQETTVRLLGTALQWIADDPDLQRQLRQSRELIPRFLEEILRMEGPIKGAFRLARRTTRLGGVDIPAGTTVLVMHSATGRDPRQFENVGELRIDRPNARRHITFGHGVHTCPGAPLARAEVRVCIERLLDATTDIRIDEDVHGPADARRWTYMPTFMFRGLVNLHLVFDPAQ